MQEHRPALILVILTLGCTLVSFTIFTGAHIQIISKVLATNTTADSVRSTNGSSITLGSPQTYTEYIHNFYAIKKPMIVNGTHELEESSTGNRIVNGTIVSDHFKVFVVNGTNGTSYAVGNASQNGNTEFFRHIGHMGADGTLRFIASSIYYSKGLVGIEKGVVYKNGTGIIKGWFWK